MATRRGITSGWLFRMYSACMSVSSGQLDLMVPARWTFLCNSAARDNNWSRSDVKGWLTDPEAVTKDTRSDGSTPFASNFCKESWAYIKNSGADVARSSTTRLIMRGWLELASPSVVAAVGVPGVRPEAGSCVSL